jgi:hypothetical protein
MNYSVSRYGNHVTRCSRSRFVLSRVIPNTIPSICWANTEERKGILTANLPGSTKARAHSVDGSRAVPGCYSHFPAGALDLGICTIRQFDFPTVRAATSIPAPLGAPCKLLVLEL